MGVQNVQQLEGSYTVLLYFTLYTIICIDTELFNDIDNTVVISCYCLMKTKINQQNAQINSGLIYY